MTAHYPRSLALQLLVSVQTFWRFSALKMSSDSVFSFPNPTASDYVIQVVKMLGFTDVLTNLLQRLRQNEINSSRLYRRIFTLRIILGMLQITSMIYASLICSSVLCAISRTSFYVHNTGFDGAHYRS